MTKPDPKNAKNSLAKNSLAKNSPAKNSPAKNGPATSHPGMMGDGTEEQNLGQSGNPEARIKKDEVDAAFAKDTKKH